MSFLQGKKILIVSPAPNIPADAGNRARVASICRYLKEEGAELHFFYLYEDDQTLPQMQNDWGRLLYLAPFQPQPFRGWQKSEWLAKIENAAQHKNSFFLKILRKIEFGFRRLRVSFFPHWAYTFEIDAWLKPSHFEAVKPLVKLNFDAVVVNYVFLSGLLDCFPPSTLKVIDTHDVFSLRHRLYLKNNERPRWFSTTASEEAKALKRADKTIAIKEEDAVFFRNLGAKGVATVGHLSQPKPCDPKKEVPYSTLFVASNNAINQLALQFLFSVWPQVRAQLPQAVFWIAGAIEPPADTPAGVQFLGKTDDLFPVYEQAALTVNPTPFGTGLKIKTLEALQHGKALLTSPAGYDGLPPEMRDTICVVRKLSADWTNDWISLLNDNELRNQYTKAATIFTQNIFQQNQSALLNSLSELI